MSDTQEPVPEAETPAVTEEAVAEAPVVEAVEEAPVVEPAVEVETPAVAPAPAGLPTDRVRVRHPEHIGVSFASVEFTPDADGAISVPAFAVPDLRAHGFEPVVG